MGILFTSLMACLGLRKKGTECSSLIISRYTEKVNSTAKAARFFRRIWDKDLFADQEQVYAIFVDIKFRPIVWPLLHTGGVCQSLLDTRVIINYATKYKKATGVFIAHNHPAGSLKFHEADKKMTRDVLGACQYLKIDFLDHIILTDESYVSVREEGLINEDGTID